MAPLTIELTKTADGGAILKCTRADGSVTWQRNNGQHGRFFAFHDLRHFAAESVLGLKRGFYGLIASGWEITDTTGKGSKGKLPDETIAVEHLIGLLDAESASGSVTSAAKINEYASTYATQNNRPSPTPIREEALAQIRSMTSALHAEWARVPEGSAMRLSFPPTAR